MPVFAVSVCGRVRAHVQRHLPDHHSPRRRYNPPRPTFSSSHGATGSTVTAASMTFTATFDSAVTGVVASDFGLASSVGTVTTSASAASSDNLVWVLSVTVTGNYAATQLSVTMADNSGSVAPANAAASNNGFLLQ